MKIEDVELSGLEFSRKSAGLPKGKFEAPKCLSTLANAKHSSGHDCWLKGIVVHAKVTASQVWWLQFGRYHHADIVSSQSKMHSILEMEPTFHPSTNKRAAESFKELVLAADDILDKEPTLLNAVTEALAMTAPMGMELTAGVVTNLLQLKTIKQQWKGHKLSEWRTFCDWIDSLWKECDL